MSLIPVVRLDLQISPRIFEKIRNGSNGILWGWGKLIHEKNQKQKISWHCPLKQLRLRFDIAPIEFNVEKQLKILDEVQKK